MHHPHQIRCRAVAGNRASAYPHRRLTLLHAKGLSSQLSVSIQIVIMDPTRAGEDRMARG